MSIKSSYAKLFGTYDIRGEFGKELSPEFVCQLGRALARYISPDKNGKFLIGHDARSSSPVLAQALMGGLLDSGQSVDYLGLASTPRVYWHGASHKYDCAIAITASHLPPQYNGLKISGAEAIPVSAENGFPEILRLFDEANSDYTPAENISINKTALAEYVKTIASFLKCTKPFKIVVDCGGGPIGPEIELFTKESGDLEVIGLGTTPDNTFSRRSANPLDPGALDELSKCVIEQKANLGAAFDADGDRVVIVDETGTMVPPDLITALIGGQIVSSKAGSKIVYDLRSSRSVPEFISALGGVPIKSRVGHALIKADMRKEKAQFAGELSGHYYWADLFYADNALRLLIELVNFASSQNKALSDLVKPLRKYIESGEVNFKGVNYNEIAKRLEKQFADGNQYFLDGLSVEYPSWWFNVRPSKTEALLRLCLGASTQDEFDKRFQEITALIKK